MRSSATGFTILLILFASCKGENIAVDKDVSEIERLFFEDYESPQAKWGYLNISGNLVINNIYDAARDFSEGLAAVNYQGKWGYINNLGEVIIPFQYRSAGLFSCERAIVQDFEYNQFIIDQSGNVVASIEDGEAFAYNDCIARISRPGKIEYLDPKGSKVMDTTAISGSNFKNGYAVIQDENGYFLIDTSGHILLDKSYDKCFIPSYGMIRVQENEQTIYVSVSKDKTLGNYANGTDFHNGVAAIDKGGWKLSRYELRG